MKFRKTFNINRKYFLIFRVLIVLILNANFARSQSLLPGDIKVEHLSGLSYLATVTVYFDQPEPKEFIIIQWGDSSESDSLYNPISIGCSNDTWNGFLYTGIHTYEEAGNFTISYLDEFLLDGISNITNSGEQAMFLPANLEIAEILNNNTPVFFNCPIWEWGCCDWIYNPAAYDQDGDSLSYSLTWIPGTDYEPTSAAINFSSGDFTWLPEALGSYAIAITVKDWRTIGNETLNLSSVNRYMLVELLDVSVLETLKIIDLIFLYPNPTKDILFISGIPQNQSTEIKITDLIGRTIKQASNKSNMDIRELPSGMYLVSIEFNGRHAVRRFIKE